MPSSVRVVIPAYNAAGTLPPLLTALRRVVEPRHILVVDDGSTDDTDRVLREAAIHAHRHARNMGKGAALKTGMQLAFQELNVSAVITMDADGQHDPDDLITFTNEWVRTGADLILGARRISGTNMPWHRKLSNTITSFLVSSRIGQRIPDSQCGFRLLSRRLGESIVPDADGFEAETEWILRSASCGYRILSVPIRTVYAGESSHMQNWATTKAFVHVLFREYSWAD